MWQEVAGIILNSTLVVSEDLIHLNIVFSADYKVKTVTTHCTCTVQEYICDNLYICITSLVPFTFDVLNNATSMSLVYRFSRGKRKVHKCTCIGAVNLCRCDTSVSETTYNTPAPAGKA